jgi:hypothetical protein
MTGQQLIRKFWIHRVMHHYFYPKGSTMVRYPELPFIKNNEDANPRRRAERADSRQRLAKVLWFERHRRAEWDGPKGMPTIDRQLAA